MALLIVNYSPVLHKTCPIEGGVSGCFLQSDVKMVTQLFRTSALLQDQPATIHRQATTVKILAPGVRLRPSLPLRRGEGPR